MRSRTCARILLNLPKPYSKSRNLLESSISTDLFEFSPFSSISRRPTSLLAAFIRNTEEKPKARRLYLSDFFRDVNSSEQSSNKYEMGAKGVCENASVVESLKKLEKQVKTNEKIKRIKILTEKVDHSAQHRSLNHVKKENKSVSSDPTIYGFEEDVIKELSPDMQIFAEHLYNQGYFKYANFPPGTKFDATLLESSYGRGFIKFAAVRFGRDHKKVAEWMSASDLKKVALFGCPTIGRSAVNAAKHIRKYFKIEEREVCQKCKLKDSCSFATKSGAVHAEGLKLDSVLRVLTLYALGSVPKKLTVPDEINVSVSGLLKEIVNLSKVVHETSDGV